MILFLIMTFFYQRLQPLMILLLLISLVFSRAQKEEIRTKMSFSRPLIWLLIYFLLHIIGVLYSTNKHEGWLDVSMKLSFFVFPVYFSLSRIHNVAKIMNWFVWIGSASVLICIATVVYKYYIYRYNPLGSESEFSMFMHRSYQAMYWGFGAVWSLYSALESKKQRWLNIFFVLILSFGVFLTFSKAGMISLILSLGIVFLIMIVHYRYIKGAIITLITGFLLLITVNYVTPKPMARFKVMVQKLTEPNTNQDSHDSNDARLMMWQTSIEAIVDKPLIGVGTGDINDELNRRNRLKGHDKFAEDSLNSHNQFLNTGVALGLTGILVLIAVFVTLFKGKVIGIKSWIVWIISGQLVFFLLTESGFETQAGVVLFTFIISLLGSTKSKHL